jgi:hypothetical protein
MAVQYLPLRPRWLHHPPLASGPRVASAPPGPRAALHCAVALVVPWCVYGLDYYAYRLAPSVSGSEPCLSGSLSSSHWLPAGMRLAGLSPVP